MEFVGEMLGRTDIIDDSDPSTSISDFEAISLAESLGMVTTTQAIRLKHALELVSHFANMEYNGETQDQMSNIEAVNLLHTCITSILGKGSTGSAIQFIAFRRSLTERSFTSDDYILPQIKSSPYFFLRTTVRVLMSLIKTENGAALEHAVGNTNLLIPFLWHQLRAAEKWQVGQTYAEVNASGNRLAAFGLRKALSEVRGFDFVPESLRSGTFNEAAATLLSAHFGFNNFYNEVAPMKTLAGLGTTIPKPAFPKCMEAIVAVSIGNRYGYSYDARPHANEMLDSLRSDQWDYYLNECVFADRTLLDKLTEGGTPIVEMIKLVRKYNLADYVISNTKVRNLIVSLYKNSPSQNNTMQFAKSLRDESLPKI
jgi:hypothetical protein